VALGAALSTGLPVRLQAVDRVVSTPEMAVHAERFGGLLADATREHPGITSRYRHRVEAVERTAQGFRVAGTVLDGELWSADTDAVVTASGSIGSGSTDNSVWRRTARGCSGGSSGSCSDFVIT
jgi:2-polyprenyl-6-methoxyphenol hydroxylase-like FAD-dependent oxidoreductase